MKQSKLFSLGIKDFIKGLLISVLGAVIGLVKVSLDAGSLNFNWTQIGTFALITALSYLTKNFLTNSEDKILKKEQ